MNYQIVFDALTTHGAVVDTLTLIVGPITEEQLLAKQKQLALQRFCVEYARLLGVRCSFVHICTISSVDDQRPCVDAIRQLSEFTVTDNQTGTYPDLERIALTEEWAKHLTYCDIEGFAISEDGALLLLDECGGVAYCPADRFTVIFESDGDN